MPANPKSLARAEACDHSFDRGWLKCVRCGLLATTKLGADFLVEKVRKSAESEASAVEALAEETKNVRIIAEILELEKVYNRRLERVVWYLLATCVVLGTALAAVLTRYLWTR